MREKSNVVIINDALARQLLPERGSDRQEPGDRDEPDPNVPTEIIGVVGDSKFADLASDARPTSYWPHPQLAYSAMTLTVRTASDPAAFAPLVEREVHAMDKDQPVADVRTDGSVGGAFAVAGAVQLDAADHVRRAGAGCWPRSASTA